MNEQEIQALFNQFLTLREAEATAKAQREALEQQGRPVMKPQYATIQEHAADWEKVVDYIRTVEMLGRTEKYAQDDQATIGERIIEQIPEGVWFQCGDKGLGASWNRANREYEILDAPWDALPELIEK